jgi:hypothetical protein
MKRPMTERITPHASLLPQGEGTPEQPSRVQQRSLSQGERDRVRGNAAGPGAHRQEEGI